MKMKMGQGQGAKGKVFYAVIVAVLFILIILMGSLADMGLVSAQVNTQTAGETPGQEGVRPADEMMAPDIAEIIERGTLRVAIPKQDLTAFFQEDEDGNLYGIDIELARDIAGSLGVEAVFERVSDNYDELTDQLKNNKADMVIATYSHSLDRIMYVDFSEPYLELQFGIMVNKQAMVRHDIKDNPVPYLKENREKIAVVEGTSHVELAKQLFGVCEIVESADYDEAVALVKTGEVFAFFSGELEFYSKYLAQPELLIYTSTYTFSDVKDEFCIGIPREKGQLLDYVNLYLASSPEITVGDVQERYRNYYRQEDVKEE